MTKKQEELAKKHGTPKKFEEAVWVAYNEIGLSIDEAEKAISKYKDEWNRAGEDFSPNKETVIMANYILNHYHKNSKQDHFCLARKLEKWAHEFTSK